MNFYRRMDQTVQERISHRRVSYGPVPFFDGKLTRDQRGMDAHPVIDDIQDIMLGLTLQGSQSPIIEDQQIHLGKLSEELEVTSVRACERELERETRDLFVDGTESIATHCPPMHRPANFCPTPLPL